MKILAEISVGELFDKITILNIKTQKIQDSEMRKHGNPAFPDLGSWILETLLKRLKYNLGLRIINNYIFSKVLI